MILVKAIISNETHEIQLNQNTYNPETCTSKSKSHPYGEKVLYSDQKNEGIFDDDGGNKQYSNDVAESI